jgi:hypothetical protein
MNIEFKNMRLLSFLIIAVVFGLGGGVVGSLITRTYFWERYFVSYSDVDLTSNNLNSGLVIRNPRNVIVEQDTKLFESSPKIKKNVLGIFEKKNITRPETGSIFTAYSAGNYYNFENAKGQAIALTSDGWILSSFTPLAGKKMSDFVAISSDRKVYPIDKTIGDKDTGMNFFHVNANDLTVLKLSARNEIRNGQTALVLNWKNSIFQSQITDLSYEALSVPYRSDNYTKRIHLKDIVPDNYTSNGLYDLEGDILGFVNKNKKIIPSFQIIGMLDGILKFDKIKRVTLGMNFVNLGNLINMADQQGLMIIKATSSPAIAKNSTAESAGLREGDIITYFAGTQIDQNSDLSDLIAGLKIGEKVKFSYIRNGKDESGEILLQ